MERRRGILLACVAAMAWNAACADEDAVRTLKVGDPAPALKPMKWIKGAPVARFEKGTVYVVEFWATWCSPCVANIPHLNEIARQQGGKAVVIGVDVQETVQKDKGVDGSIELVEKFVRKQGEKMSYVVAMDHPEDKPLVKSWIKAAGFNSIPVAFVVDSQGKIAWAGQPSPSSNYLGEVVAQVIDGSYDRTQADAEKILIGKVNEFLRQRRKLSEPVVEALQRKDYAGALAQVDIYLPAAGRLAKEVPNLELVLKFWGEGELNKLLDHEAEIFPHKLKALLHLNEAEGLAYARGKVWFSEATPKALPVEYLASEIADDIAEEDGLSKAAYGYAVELEKEMLARVFKAEPGAEAAPGSYVTLAKAHYQLGEVDEAIAAQQKAIKSWKSQEAGLAKAKRRPSFERYMATLQAQLDRYQEAKEP